ncbi:MAG TPA: serine/threonine-protein kinase, partial [Steroidobacteraceae bacterium]|nr:serine/threonine-protein kinase [Steroidobacteraceae bacterium]
MNINPADWPRLSVLLDQALDMTSDERAVWLAQLPPHDQPLSHSLRKLLEQQARVETRDVLQVPPDFAGALLAESTRHESFAGELTPNATIGAYRLISELGVGGMGAVWLAERVDGKLKRQVALKFPYAGPFQRQLAERIIRERDILASLEHPNIARLYDADVTTSGSPFLVLEYVDGVPINEYCETHKLNIRQRLILFLQVLTAVQYAHARLVIHRDIKPSNILITQDGEAHLLDFGVAKLMPAGLAKETVLTHFTGRALTPDYASPEQITGSVVTTASDVYSLGVVRYELLVGARPYRLKRDSRASLEDAIAEADAVVPSRAVKSAFTDAQSKSSAAKRAAQLRGDLDAILLKALRKDVASRYTTADAFREDIERHLDGRMVLVQSANVGYRLRKFLRRNRLASAATAAVVVALAVGLGVALWQAQQAKKQALAARAVQQFMQDIFRANSSNQPDPAQARQTTARQLLDVGAKNLRTTLDATPEAKLEILSTLAAMYSDLGLDDQGVELQHERLRLATSQYGDRDPRTIVAMLDLAEVMHASNSRRECAAVLAKAKEILDQLGDRSSLLRARLLALMSQESQSANRAESLRLSDEALVIFRQHPPSPIFSTALLVAAQGNLGVHNWEAALRLLEEAIVVEQSIGSHDQNRLAELFVYRAQAFAKLDRYPEAESQFTRALEIAGGGDGGQGLGTVEVATRFGLFLCDTSRFNEGLKKLAQATDIVLKVRGPDDSSYTPKVQYTYGMELINFGEPEQALEHLEKAVANRRKNRPNSAILAQTLEDYSAALLMIGATDAAKSALDESFILHERNHNSPVLQFDYQLDLIEWLLATSHTDEAARVASKLAVEPLTDKKLPKTWLAATLAQSRIALASGDAHKAATLASQVNETLVASSLRTYLKLFEAEAALTQGAAELALKHLEVAKPLL